MSSADGTLGRILVGSGILDHGQLRAAEAQIARWGGRLQHVVAEMGFAREDAVARAIAAATGVPQVELRTVPPDPAALHRLDPTFCEERNVFPCALRDGGATLWLATSDPTDGETLAAAGRAAGVAQVRAVVAGFDEIVETILRHYRGETTRRWMTGEFHRAAPRAPAMPGTTAVPVPAGAPVAMAQVVPSPRPAPPGGWPVPPPETSLRLAASPGNETIARSLDELLGLAGLNALGPEDRRRLATLRANQDRIARVLRAILELCSERGVLDLEGFRSRAR